MQALVLSELKTPLELRTRPDLSAKAIGAKDVVVRLRAAALNRRDYWITQGKYPNITLPIVLGSDGVGIVTARGSEVENTFGAGEVIINPGWQWGENLQVQSNEFQILGLPHDGTLAEEVRIPAEHIWAKPLHLSSVQAAALPLAGVTAYRALFGRGGLQAGQNILVTGVGGGVATFVVQFAVAAGANVYVTSSSDAKIAAAIGLGGIAGFNYTDPLWHQALQSRHGLMDVIIDGTGGPGYAKLIDVAAPAGRIVSYGSTAGAPERLDLFQVFWKQLNLLGSTMGSELDFGAMLDFVNLHQIQPAVDSVRPWMECNQALERMKAGHQFGKLVLVM